MTFIPGVKSKVSTNNSTNSTTVPFIGTGEDVSAYGSITVMIKSDFNSAGSGVSLQFSPDNTNWDDFIVSTYFSNINFSKTIIPLAQYYRIVYTANSTPTTLRIQTILNTTKQPVDQPQKIEYMQNQLDAFGRIRTSEPFAQVDSTYLLGFTGATGADPTKTSLVTGSGALTLDSNATVLNMSVTDASVGRAVVQSRRRGVYQPGKSQQILLTGVLNTNSNPTGSMTQMGYFDDDNGIFFRCTGDGSNGINSIVIRSSTSGSGNIVENDIPQSEWNIDQMNGTGSSGIVYDPTKANVYYIDFEWLSVGEVRAGIVIDNIVYYMHKFKHGNIVTLPYMAVPSLPVRYEIVSSSPVNASMRSICYTINSEGGFNPVGRIFSVNRLKSTVTTVGATPARFSSLISLRIKDTSNNKNISANITGFNILLTSSNKIALYELRIYRDVPDSSILTSPTWIDSNINSSVEYSINGNPLITPEPQYTILTSGYIENNGNIFNNFQDNNTFMTVNINSISDIIVLAVSSTLDGTNNTITCFGSITWKEIL